MKESPCEEWTTERVNKFMGEGKTLSEILDMKKIPAPDRIWAVTRFLSDKVNRQFAVWCARQCKTDRKEIINYIDVIEKFYDGKATKEELRATNRAAKRQKQINKLKELVNEKTRS